MNGNALERKSRPLRYSDDRPFRMHLLLQALLDPHACFLPAYKLFRSLPHTAKVVTWNYDRLASQYCPQEVLSMHGLVSTFSEINDQMIGPFYWSTRSFYSSQKIIFPGEREDMDKLDEPNLTKFENWIKNATSIIMIGYRFGWGDDQETWRVFCDNVGPLVPVHVVDPNDTQHIARQIGYGLRRFERCNGIYSLSKTKSIVTTIIGQPFSWAHLAKLFLGNLPLCSWLGNETILVNACDRISHP